MSIVVDSPATPGYLLPQKQEAALVKFRVFLERISDKAQCQRDFDTVSAERAETLARTMCRIIREDYRVLSVEQVGSVWTK